MIRHPVCQYNQANKLSRPRTLPCFSLSHHLFPMNYIYNCKQKQYNNALSKPVLFSQNKLMVLVTSDHRCCNIIIHGLYTICIKCCICPWVWYGHTVQNRYIIVVVYFIVVVVTERIDWSNMTSRPIRLPALCASTIMRRNLLFSLAERCRTCRPHYILPSYNGHVVASCD